ncbi:MAG: HAMP domain-containing histidine kinase [Anaerolineae bacterium]|nr:HAMP domain-containing histidine kinase [Anaerolineae bacterium]
MPAPNDPNQPDFPADDPVYRALVQHIKNLEVAYQELHAAGEQKQKQLEEVVHDLRAPLSFITAYIDMLANDEFGPLSGEQKQILLVVHKKAQQMSGLVKSLSDAEVAPDFSREVMSLAGAARTAVQSAGAAAEEAGLLLIIMNVPDDLPDVWANPNQICRVFENLLSNAIKFSPPGGEIVVSICDLGPEEKALRASVRDHGIGIPAIHHDDIWKRFFRVENDLKYEGTGLGLSIVREIVEMHGGKVGVESAPGAGSTFYFTLPYAPNLLE